MHHRKSGTDILYGSSKPILSSDMQNLKMLSNSFFGADNLSMNPDSNILGNSKQQKNDILIERK